MKTICRILSIAWFVGSLFWFAAGISIAFEEMSGSAIMSFVLSGMSFVLATAWFILSTRDEE